MHRISIVSLVLLRPVLPSAASSGMSYMISSSSVACFGLMHMSSLAANQDL